MGKIIILDWDDTLFPTSWCINKDINFITEKDINVYIEYFRDLDVILKKFLQKCVEHGRVFIVTNAMENWVYKSCEVLPLSYKLIKMKIIVLSARDLYQRYTLNISSWKLHVFEHIVNEYTKINGKDHIISIGDAEYEFNALLNLLNHKNIKNGGYLKAVRLISSPSYNSIMDQISVLDNSIKKICLHENHLDLKFAT